MDVTLTWEPVQPRVRAGSIPMIRQYHPAGSGTIQAGAELVSGFADEVDETVLPRGIRQSGEEMVLVAGLAI